MNKQTRTGTAANGHIIESKGGSPPSELSMRGFVRHLRDIDQNCLAQSIVFLLGAGASITSGVRSAADLADEWMREMYDDRHGSRVMPFEAWIKSDKCPIRDLNPDDLADKYSEIYDEHFRHRPEVGRGRLIQAMRKAEPGFGYSVLAQLLAKERHKTVITTNFDHLVEKALLYYTDQPPLTCTHQTTASAMGRGTNVPLVVKCHHDLYLDPKSSVEDTAELHKNFGTALHSLLPRNTLVVIGYGGNDRSMMGFLEKLEPQHHPETVYWCYYEPRGQPPRRILDVLGRYRAVLVPISGFDGLMAGIADAFNFRFLVDEMEQRHRARVERYKKQLEEIGKPQAASAITQIAQTRVTGSTSVGPTKAVKTGTSNKSTEPPVASADSDKPEKGGSAAFAAEAVRRIAAKPEDNTTQMGWQTRAWNAKSDDEKDRIYTEALVAHPHSVTLLGNYATFTRYVRKNYDKAQELYERAIEADPNNAVNLGNYANFLTRVRKQHDRAQEFYERAIKADPNSAVTLGNYAVFLMDIRKDYDKAQEFYERTTITDPSNGINLGNYANLLTNIRKEHDKAHLLYERSIKADPNYATHLDNYASFLTSIRKDHERAEELYKRSIEANPTYAHSLGNYTKFLLEHRDVKDALAMLDRAIAALTDDTVKSQHVETWMYAVCHWLPDKWREALTKLKPLLVEQKITTGEWDFSGVIARAKERGHPDAAWLDDLAMVCAGKAEPKSLDGWEAWRKA